LHQQARGRLIGVSRRTAQRLDSGQSSLAQHHLATLAEAVYPRNPELAARLAASAGLTLTASGIASQAGTEALSPLRLAVDSVPCATADAMGAVLPRRPR